jgi:flagellar biosynthesis protein FlhF
MRLRLFRDATLHGAMARVRAALGPDALILATRRVGGGVEVTAALDQPDEARPDPPYPEPPYREPPYPEPPCPKPPHPEPPRARALAGAGAATPRHEPAAASRAPAPELAAEGERVRLAQLDWHGVPPALARRLRAGPLTFALSLALRFAALDLVGAAPLLLVGPPGAGKTLTIVRLATRLVLAGVRPIVVCADGARAGAAEQVAAFTRLLGVELIEAASADEVAAATRARAGGGPVLIDTPGADPWGGEATDLLAGLAASLRARLVAVLPAGLDAAEAADLAEGYMALGAGAMVATRLDVARRLGGVLSAAATGLPLVEAGIGPGAADGLVPATPDLLARRLLAPRPARRGDGPGGDRRP